MPALGVLVVRAASLLLLAGGVFPLANVLTAGQAVPWFGGAAREWSERGILLLLVALLISWWQGPRVDAVARRLTSALLQPSSPRFATVMAAVAFAGAAGVSWWAFAGQPFTSDEMAQQFHARVLAAGRLSAVAESPREFFNTAPVLDTGGRWLSQYPVGGPALIALGVLIGAPWLVNPVLLALAVWTFYRFLSAATSELVARGATLLLALSPMVLVMAGSQMNHVAAVAFTTTALFLVTRWELAAGRAPQLRAAAGVGVAVGLVATIRPLDAVIVALAIGGLQAWRAMREPTRWISLGVQMVAASIPIALLLWVNARTTGSPLVFGYAALNGPEHGLGFHLDPAGEMHSPLRGLIFASGYLMRLSLYFFEWPIPGVLAIAAGLLALRRPSHWDLALVALMLGFVAGYAAYWFDGFFAGPRFLFGAVPAFAYFAARAPGIAERGPPVLRRAAGLVIPLCVLVAWLGPWGVSSAPSRVALYREQRTKLKTDVEGQAARERMENVLVFVNEGWRGRLLARLRVLGATQFRAERVLNTADACALQTVLDGEGGLANAPDSARLERVMARARAFGDPRPVPGLPADRAVMLVPGSQPTPACLAEVARDTTGTMPYALFLARQHVGWDGRIGGSMVFARDLGPWNEALRQRFGDRAWYRYRPAPALGDTIRAFIPYVR